MKQSVPALSNPNPMYTLLSVSEEFYCNGGIKVVPDAPENALNQYIIVQKSIIIDGV